MIRRTYYQRQSNYIFCQTFYHYLWISSLSVFRNDTCCLEHLHAFILSDPYSHFSQVVKTSQWALRHVSLMTWAYRWMVQKEGRFDFYISFLHIMWVRANRAEDTEKARVNSFLD